MTKRSRTPILLVCAAVGVACGSEAGVAPKRPAVFTTLEVAPAVADLFTVAPGNTVQLSTAPLDQTGARMPGAGAATYSSSAPAIAGVSSAGVVTAAVPGTAVITATLTLGGITQTASMTATVHDPRDAPVEYVEMAGVYDLTAMITGFDPAWGDLAGYRYTAVLTLWEEWGPPWFGGTYADLRLIGPGGDSSAVAGTGFVMASIDFSGRVVVELSGDQDRIELTLMVGTLASGFIDGRFGCCGHIGGTFTATRRAPE